LILPDAFANTQPTPLGEQRQVVGVRTPLGLLRKNGTSRCFNETSNRPYRLSASIGLVQAPAADAAAVDTC
jgi:hypothetical protein